MVACVASVKGEWGGRKKKWREEKKERGLGRERKEVSLLLFFTLPSPPTHPNACRLRKLPA